MQENYDKKTNVFCKARMLNGKRLTYQFPNDLRKAMLQSYHEGSLKEILNGALINVPTTKYNKKGQAVLHLGQITQVFIATHRSRWRTRGQFLTSDSWQGNDKADIRFLLHDHSFLNKVRIRLDLFKWRSRLYIEKGIL